MKSSQIRSLSQSSRRRNIGDQPDLGPVARIPGASKRLETSRRRGRRSKRSAAHLTDRRRIRQIKARKFAITLWLTIILTGCFVVMATVSVLWLRAQKDRRGIALRYAPIESEVALTLTDFPPPAERDAIGIIYGAIASEDADTLLQFVHQSGEVSVDEMLGFFAATEERDGILTGHQWVGSADTETLQIQSIILAFEKEGKPNYRMGMLVPTESGEWKMDFPSYARWCDPPIQQIEESGGYPGGLVRAILANDLYFNGPFSDDREWACFQLSSPDVESSVFAYCRIDSPEHEAIAKAFAQGARQIRMTLEIARVDGAQPRQFLITRIVNQEWLASYLTVDEQ